MSERQKPDNWDEMNSSQKLAWLSNGAVSSWSKRHIKECPITSQECHQNCKVSKGCNIQNDIKKQK